MAKQKYLQSTLQSTRIPFLALLYMLIHKQMCIIECGTLQNTQYAQQHNKKKVKRNSTHSHYMLKEL